MTSKYNGIQGVIGTLPVIDKTVGIYFRDFKCFMAIPDIEYTEKTVADC